MKNYPAHKEFKLILFIVLAAKMAKYWLNPGFLKPQQGLIDILHQMNYLSEKKHILKK